MAVEQDAMHEQGDRPGSRLGVGDAAGRRCDAALLWQRSHRSVLPAMGVVRDRRIGFVESPRTGLTAHLDRIAAELDLYRRGIELAVASRAGSCCHRSISLQDRGSRPGMEKGIPDS